MKTMKIMMFMVMIAATIACSKDDVTSFYESSYDTDSSADGSGQQSESSTDLKSFTIAVDKETAEPTEVATAYYPEDEDNLNNSVNSGDFVTEVAIDVSGISDGEYNGVTVTHDGNNIVCNHGSNKVCYVLSGTTTNSSVTIMGEKKCEIKLNGVSITSPDSAALNVLCKKRCFLYLADGTTNTLTDTKCSRSNEHKGALYCKGKLLIHGTGKLNVYGNHRNGIHSADYIIFNQGNNVYVKTSSSVTENGHGIKANDGIFINGGILNIEVEAAAAKGLNCEADIIINGGRTTAITTGGGTYEDSEAKGSAGIKADLTYTQNAGTVKLYSQGNGGKGLSTDGISTINGGELWVITSGGQYSSNGDTASPKGIKVDSNIVINGGTVKVRTSGRNGEGIESKAELYINDGTVQVAAYDDGLNSKSNTYIKGGSIVAVGSNSDGVDSNGNLYISGGNLVAIGASGAETGIDVGEQYRLYVTGGSFFGIGGRNDCTVGSTTQGICSTSGSVTANSTVTVSNTDGTTLATFIMPPYSYSNGTIMTSAAGMNSNNTYTINLGSTSVTATAQTYVSSSMGGGGGPGGRW